MTDCKAKARTDLLTGFNENARRRAAQDRDAINRRADILAALDGVLTFARRERLSEVLTDGEAAALAVLAGQRASANTLRAVAADLEHLAHWHRVERQAPLPWPPEPATVFEWLDQQKDAVPATLKRRLTSWKRLVHAMGHDSKAFSAVGIKERLTRYDASPRLPSPQSLGAGAIAELLAACPEDTLAGKRDRALLSAAFLLDLRPGELAALELGELRTLRSDPQSAPRLCLTRARKKPRVLPDAVAATVSQWIAAAALTSGPLFRNVDRWGKPGKRAITAQSVKLVVRRRAAEAGLDPARLTARSLRQGHASRKIEADDTEL